MSVAVAAGMRTLRPSPITARAGPACSPPPSTSSPPSLRRPASIADDHQVVRPLQPHLAEAQTPAAPRPRRCRRPGSARPAAPGRRRNCAPATDTGAPPAARPRRAHGGRGRRSGVRPAGSRRLRTRAPAGAAVRCWSNRSSRRLPEPTALLACRRRQGRPDRGGVEQVQRLRQRIAATGLGGDLDAGLRAAPRSASTPRPGSGRPRGPARRRWRGRGSGVRAGARSSMGGIMEGAGSRNVLRRIHKSASRQANARGATLRRHASAL